MTTTPSEEPFFITPPYGILLHGSQEMPIGLCHLGKGSAAQLTRLHYSEKSVKLVKKRLRVLSDHGFVEFDAMPTARYRSPYYYVLGNSGVEYIKSLGMSISSSYRPSKEIGQNYLHLLHHAGVNDVLIAAAILKRRVPEYTLADFKLTRELASEPFNALWHGKSYGSVPDLFLDFRQALPDGRQRRTPILIEHDRGTESEEVIRRKIHAYAGMITSGWYKTRYVNSISITIAFTTFEGERRRNKLREWARQELHGKDRSLASSFLFTAQPQPPDPQHMWLNPCWWPCVDSKPVAILGE